MHLEEKCRCHYFRAVQGIIGRNILVSDSSQIDLCDIRRSDFSTRFKILVVDIRNKISDVFLRNLRQDSKRTWIMYKINDTTVQGFVKTLVQFSFCPRLVVVCETSGGRAKIRHLVVIISIRKLKKRSHSCQNQLQNLLPACVRLFQKI